MKATVCRNIFLNTAANNPIRGGTYIKTPVSIEGKQAIINVQNSDTKCFMWAILSALHEVKQDAERVTKYEKYESELDFTGISFPMNIDDIPKFEKLNDIPISVYTIEEKGKQVYPLYYTKRRDQDPISLLLIGGEDKFHYAWIKHSTSCSVMIDKIQKYSAHTVAMGLIREAKT